jgi:hypothetical protein
MNQLKPPIWISKLPFPLEELSGAEIEVITGDRQRTFSANLAIHRHPKDDNLFSIDVRIDELFISQWVHHQQLLHLPEASAALIVRHPSNESGFRFLLPFPPNVLDHLPPQLR